MAQNTFFVIGVEVPSNMVHHIINSDLYFNLGDSDLFMYHQNLDHNSFGFDSADFHVLGIKIPLSKTVFKLDRYKPEVEEITHKCTPIFNYIRMPLPEIRFFEVCEIE